MNNIPDNKLTIQQVCKLLDGTILCGEQNISKLVSSACGCDLMSDALAYTKPGSVLLTGLTNSQVVRTAEMLDLKVIVFVRSKRPEEQTVNMAKSMGLTLILSPLSLYDSCGLLYNAGLPGCLQNMYTKVTTPNETIGGHE